MLKLIIILAAALAFAYYATVEFETTFGPDADKQACTLEAKLCPDGTAVGRTGPRCEFAACPGE